MLIPCVRHFWGEHYWGGFFGASLLGIALNSGAASEATDRLGSAITRLLNAVTAPFIPTLNAFTNWFVQLPLWIQILGVLGGAFVIFSAQILSIIVSLRTLGVTLAITTGLLGKWLVPISRAGRLATTTGVKFSGLNRVVTQFFGSIGLTNVAVRALARPLLLVGAAVGFIAASLGIATGWVWVAIAAIGILTIVVLDLIFGWGILNTIVETGVKVWQALVEPLKQVWDWLFPLGILYSRFRPNCISVLGSH